MYRKWLGEWEGARTAGMGVTRTDNPLLISPCIMDFCIYVASFFYSFDGPARVEPQLRDISKTKHIEYVNFVPLSP